MTKQFAYILILLTAFESESTGAPKAVFDTRARSVWKLEGDNLLDPSVNSVNHIRGRTRHVFLVISQSYLNSKPPISENLHWDHSSFGCTSPAK